MLYTHHTSKHYTHPSIYPLLPTHSPTHPLTHSPTYPPTTSTQPPTHPPAHSPTHPPSTAHTNTNPPTKRAGHGRVQDLGFSLAHQYWSTRSRACEWKGASVRHHIYVHTYMYMYMHIYMHVYVYVYAYIYMYIHTSSINEQICRICKGIHGYIHTTNRTCQWKSRARCCWRRRKMATSPPLTLCCRCHTHDTHT